MCISLRLWLFSFNGMPKEILIVLMNIQNVIQDHLRRLLRGQASLFDWSRSTSLARTLSPRVLENQIDTKKVCDLQNEHVFDKLLDKQPLFIFWLCLASLLLSYAKLNKKP